MEMGPVDAKAGSDRFATCDEIRAALFSLHDLFLESPNENDSEIDSELGGQVLFGTDDDELLKLLVRLNMPVN